MADEAKTPEVTDTSAAAGEERFNKPNKDDLDKRVGDIEGEIKDLQAKQEALHDFRKAATAGGPKTGPLADARAAFKVIADKARVLRDERKGYFDQLALMKGAREKMVRETACDARARPVHATARRPPPRPRRRRALSPPPPATAPPRRLARRRSRGNARRRGCRRRKECDRRPPARPRHPAASSLPSARR